MNTSFPETAMSVFTGMARFYGTTILVGARHACDMFAFAGMARSYHERYFPVPAWSTQA